MAYKRNSPQPVAEGGTGALTLTGVLTGNGTAAITANTVTQSGILIGGVSNAVSSLAVAATGQALMGNTGADPSFTGSPSFSGSVTAGTTITASSGDITITAGRLLLPNTTSSTVGSIFLNNARVLHCFANTTNLFLGQSAGNFTLTATGTTTVGTNSGLALTNATNNTACGSLSLASATTSASNTAIGNNALNALNTGVGFNIALGASAGKNLTTGIQNTILGSNAGVNYTGSETNNIIIGYNITGTAAENNTIRIGNASNGACFISGINGATSASGIAVLVNASNQLGTTTSSIRFKQNVQDIGKDSEALYKLRPVSFNYKVSKHVTEIDSQLKQYGLIAEDVVKVFPELVKYNLDGEIESVRYLTLIPLLLNEIQKLNKRIESLESK